MSRIDSDSAVAPTQVCRSVRAGFLPDDAIAPSRAASAPAPGEVLSSHYRMCVACGEDHPGSLHLTVTAGEGCSVHGVLVIGDLHQGAPGLAHGGIITTALDEGMGWLQILVGHPAVTAHLETDFRRPVPVGSGLFLEARVLGQAGRKVFCEATARLDAPDGPIAACAAAIFLQVPVEHFLTHGAPDHVERAVEERRAGAPRWWGDVNP